MHELWQEVEKARQLLISTMGRQARDMDPAEAEEFFRAEFEAMIETLMNRHWNQ
jgi:hypothetical protein